MGSCRVWFPCVGGEAEADVRRFVFRGRFMSGPLLFICRLVGFSRNVRAQSSPRARIK